MADPRLRIIIEAIDQFSGVLDKSVKSITRNSEQVKAAGRGITAIGVGIAGMGVLSLKAAIDFESAFAGVRKTVDATDEQFDSLRAGIRKMATEIPVTTTELAAIGEAAGQLGIEVESIESFTRVMAQLGVTTNLTSDEAASALARIANITKLPQDEFENLGSVLVDLGNNFATTEREIIEFGLRLAGAGTIAGLSQPEILAIGTAMSSVGVQAEAGGTAVQKVLLEITAAVSTASPAVQGFAKVAGLSAQEFAEAWKDDAAGAFTLFVEGLGAAGDDAIGILDELGLQDQRLIRSFLSLANAGDLLRRAIDQGSQAWEENTALSKEAEQRFKTTAAQMQLVLNQVSDLAIEVGNILLPTLVGLVDGMKDVLANVKDWASENPELTKVIVIATLAIGALALALGPLLILLPGIVAIAPLVGVAITLMFGPVGIAIVLVAALAAAVILNWDVVKSATMALWNFIRPIFDSWVGFLLPGGPLLKALLFLKDNWREVLDAMGAAIASGVNFIIDRLNELIRVFNNVRSVFGQDAIQEFEKIEQVFNLVADAAKAKADALNVLYTVALPKIVAAMDDATESADELNGTLETATDTTDDFAFAVRRWQRDLGRTVEVSQLASETVQVWVDIMNGAAPPQEAMNLALEITNRNLANTAKANSEAANGILRLGDAQRASLAPISELSNLHIGYNHLLSETFNSLIDTTVQQELYRLETNEFTEALALFVNNGMLNFIQSLEDGDITLEEFMEAFRSLASTIADSTVPAVEAAEEAIKRFNATLSIGQEAMVNQRLEAILLAAEMDPLKDAMDIFVEAGMEPMITSLSMGTITMQEFLEVARATEAQMKSLANAQSALDSAGVAVIDAINRDLGIRRAGNLGEAFASAQAAGPGTLDAFLRSLSGQNLRLLSDVGLLRGVNIQTGDLGRGALGGTTVIIFEGDVIGLEDFEEKVALAVQRGQEAGRFGDEPVRQRVE